MVNTRQFSRISGQEFVGRFGFAGHQTFPFRYGWLKKAVDGVRHDPRLFNSDEAIVRLGVGKNMVESIRHWGLATRMLEEGDGGLVVSKLGEELLEHWDPDLEDPASLWLIHWQLATNPAAATWRLAFSRYPRPDFSKRQLLHYLADFAARQSLRAKESTLSRDVDCFVRTYLPSLVGIKGVVEDSFACPLVELELLQPFLDGESYQFVIGPKPTLPPAIVGYCLIQYWSQTRPNRETLAIDDCLYGDASPGQVFKLDENSLVEYAEELQLLTDGRLQLDETTGLRQFYRSVPVEAASLLHGYYAARSTR
jgi:hypothetical protein